MSLLEAAERALAAAAAEAPGLAVEVYAARGRERALERRNGRPEVFLESAEEGLGLRVADSGRMAFVCGAGLSEEDARALARRAKAQLPLLPPDPARVLPKPVAGGAGAALAATLEDPDAFRRPLGALAPELDEAAAAARRRHKAVKSVLHAGFSETFSEVAIVSTTGVRAYERGSSAGVGFSMSAARGGEVQVGSGSRAARRAADLDWSAAAEDAAFRASVLLGAKKLPGKRRDVLFDPWVAGDVLELLAGPLSADAVQKGRSLFKGRVGKRVASAAVTLLDDPHRPGGLGSALFDDEGLPTVRKAMLERGVLKGFYYDAYTAARDGVASNASASRGGYRGLPGPSPTNLVLQPGSLSRQGLLDGTRDGILVFEIMGMHTADPVSGELSVGVSGVAVRKGELAFGIKGAMLSTNLLQLFKSVDAVADDLVSYGSLSAPTFRAAGLQVA